MVELWDASLTLRTHTLPGHTFQVFSNGKREIVSLIAAVDNRVVFHGRSPRFRPRLHANLDLIRRRWHCPSLERC